jgi:hypothetical protein
MFLCTFGIGVKSGDFTHLEKNGTANGGPQTMLE